MKVHEIFCKKQFGEKVALYVRVLKIPRGWLSLGVVIVGGGGAIVLGGGGGE